MSAMFYLIGFLVLFGFHPQALACNTAPLPYEWPLFGNQEKSIDSKGDEEFLHFLLDAMREGREFALDAWATPKLKNGIVAAIGVRRFIELLREADKAGNGFACLELQGRKQFRPNEDDKTYERLALEKNPGFLLNIFCSPHEHHYFATNFGHLLSDVPGQTIQERLINTAIAKNSNPARFAKADWLIMRSQEQGDDRGLAEAFDLFRYVAHRGFSEAMYSLYQLLQTYPQFAYNALEHMDYLSAATELCNKRAQYASALFAAGKSQFSQAHAHLDALLENLEHERDCYDLKESALFLKDFFFLLERKFIQENAIATSRP